MCLAELFWDRQSQLGVMYINTTSVWMVKPISRARHRDLPPTLGILHGTPHLDECAEPLGSDQAIATGGQFGYLVPIDLAHIQPKGNPSSRSNVRGQIESIRID